MLKVPSLPLPAGVPALLSLFEGPLAEVQFPDVAGAVDRASLSDLAERTVVASDALARARVAIADAQQALAEAEAQVIACEASLLTKAHRALSYARVFAEGNLDLTHALSAIELAGSGGLLTNLFAPAANAPAPRPKRRGRPKSSTPVNSVTRGSTDGHAATDLFVPAESEREVAAAS